MRAVKLDGHHCKWSAEQRADSGANVDSLLLMRVFWRLVPDCPGALS